MRLLVTDLDNTLYDWVTFFAHAFEAMVAELAHVLQVDRERLLDEFKVVHQRYGNSEQPFATLELPSVQNRLPGMSPFDRVQRLQPAFDAFNRERSRHLHLYPGVREALVELVDRGVLLVGHTEAIAVNAYHRLRLLEIEGLFRRLYTLEGRLVPHPDPLHTPALAAPNDVVREVPRSERKPNPGLLLDICAREGVSPEDAVYVGDSLTRDVAMAKDAGVTAVWARYGNQYERRLWAILVRVTHWTDDDVAREARLREHARGVCPDHAIDEYREIIDICTHASQPGATRGRASRA